MVKYNYQVDGYFSFQQTATSPSEIREALKRALKKEGMIEKNFEISVEKIVLEKKGAMPLPKKAKKKVAKRKKSQART